MESAFGIDHGEFSKADKPNKKATGGRYAAAFAPGHGLAAGKKGKKIRTQANETLPAMAGAGVGTAADLGLAAASRGHIRTHGIGGLAGGVTGSHLGVDRNSKKGYYKPQNAT